MREPAGRFLTACIAAVDGRELTPDVLPGSRAGWKRALRLAASLALGPLVYDRLRRMPTSPSVPAPVWRRLQLLFHSSGLRMARFRAELGRVLRALRRVDVPVIALKGAAFAEAVWGNLAVRPMGDVDLMVPDEELVSAQEVLVGLGYVPIRTRRSPGWYRDRHHHLVPLHDPATGVVVEIHRNIAAPSDSFELDAREFWRRARAQAVAGVEVLALSPADTVIHLCLHTAADDPFVGKARSVADLVQIIGDEGHPLAWDEIAERSVQYGIARFVHYVLDYVAADYGAVIPARATRAIRAAAAVDPLSDRLLRWMIPLCVFRDEARDRLVANWRLRRASEALLRGEGALGRMAALLEWPDRDIPLRPVVWLGTLSRTALGLLAGGMRALCPPRESSGDRGTAH